MPYTYKKEGDKYVVYKTNGKRVGATAGNKEALRKYLAALHIHANENMKLNELTAATKAAKIKSQQEKIKLIKTELEDAQEELKTIQATPVTGKTDEAFKLSLIAKTILEAEDDVATTGEDPEADTPSDEGGDKEDSEDTDKAKSSSSLMVKFNMAKVKKYNQYPVVDNSGEVVGVSKNGLSVKVGDNIVLVNFEDLLD